MAETFHNDAVFVAVNQYVRESEKTLLWALRNFQGKKLVLLHVHHPFSLTSSSSWLQENEVSAIQESLLKDTSDSLHKYRDICIKKGVNTEDVDTALTSGHDAGEGIVELIYQHKIKKLVMGAAADPHYSRGMSITSRKAEYVSQHAPNYCKMRFICKGKLIKTREGTFGIGKQVSSFSEVPANPPTSFPEVPAITHGNKPAGSAGSQGAESSPSPPWDYICPITWEIMREPVVAADGVSYNKKAIERWIREGNQTSPKTRKPLTNHTLTPNYTLRSLIKDWLEQHPNYID